VRGWGVRRVILGAASSPSITRGQSTPSVHRTDRQLARPRGLDHLCARLLRLRGRQIGLEQQQRYAAQGHLVLKDFGQRRFS